eukprot:Rmarinus@m.20610
MATFPLEGDGLVENIYHYLWQKNQDFESCRILFPDTIIFKYRQPAYWYYSSIRTGQVKKKNKPNVNNPKIIEALSKTRKGLPKMKSEIVAYHIQCEGDPKKDGQTTVEYFNVAGLSDFLMNQEKKYNGIIQRFVDPKGTKQAVIRATWSPHVCLLERRVNHKKLADTKFDMHARAVTFDGDEFYSESAPFQGDSVANAIESMIRLMVEHILSVSRGIEISRLVLYFKVDDQNRFWFLWCSSLRVHHVFVDRMMPLNLTQKFELKENTKITASMSPIRRANTATSKAADQGSRLRKCPNCRRAVDGTSMMEATYKSAVVQHLHSKANTHRGTFRAGPEVVPTSNLPHANLFTADITVADSLISSLVNSRIPPSRQGQRDGRGQQTDSSGNQVDAPYYEGKTVPPMLATLHPEMRYEQFVELIRDPSFLLKVAEVCETCALRLNDTAQENLHTVREKGITKPPGADPDKSHGQKGKHRRRPRDPSQRSGVQSATPGLPSVNDLYRNDEASVEHLLRHYRDGRKYNILASRSLAYRSLPCSPDRRLSRSLSSSSGAALPRPRPRDEDLPELSPHGRAATNSAPMGRRGLSRHSSLVSAREGGQGVGATSSDEENEEAATTCAVGDGTSNGKGPHGALSSPDRHQAYADSRPSGKQGMGKSARRGSHRRLSKRCLIHQQGGPGGRSMLAKLEKHMNANASRRSSDSSDPDAGSPKLADLAKSIFSKRERTACRESPRGEGESASGMTSPIADRTKSESLAPRSALLSDNHSDRVASLFAEGVQSRFLGLLEGLTSAANKTNGSSLGSVASPVASTASPSLR